MASEISALFIGDVVGEKALSVLCEKLIPLQEKYNANLTIVNGENIWNGKGLNENDANSLTDLGVHVITTGNHVWDNWKSRPLLVKNKRVLRPFNYPQGNPGFGFAIVDIDQTTNAAILQLQGRTYMQTIDCPFRGADNALKLIGERTKNVFVDFHAEATGEKWAMGWHLDGRVSAIMGTHTHVQTADEQILPDGTAYISDVGMTGPYDSVLGMKKEVALKRFTLQTAHKYELAENDIRISGVNVRIDADTGQAKSIERFVDPPFVRNTGMMA
jgi:hypothetical protein